MINPAYWHIKKNGTFFIVVRQRKFLWWTWWQHAEGYFALYSSYEDALREFEIVTGQRERWVDVTNGERG